MTFLIISSPKQNGPLGLIGVKEPTEKGHLDHVKGLNFESQVVKCFEEISSDRSFGLKIFHDVPMR